MTPLDKILPFVIERWGMVFLACGLATVICFVERRSRWIIAIWLPSFSLAAAYTLFFFCVFFAPRGSSSPNDGYLGIALMFQAMVSLPVFLATVLLPFARPPSAAWRSPFLVVGLALAGVVPLLLRTAFLATQLSVSFLVTDRDGNPLRGVGFSLPGDPPPVASTDDRGQLTRRVEQGYDLSGAFTSDGYLVHSVSVSVSGAHGRSLFVVHDWLRPSRGYFRTVESDQTTYPISPPPRILIIMKPIAAN